MNLPENARAVLYNRLLAFRRVLSQGQPAGKVGADFGFSEHTGQVAGATPYHGLLLFVMRGVAPPGTTMAEICTAAIPFMACALALVGLLIWEPRIALFLGTLGD